MNRRIEILEESTITRRVTRIHETDTDADPPEVTQVCIDCGDVREAIEDKTPLVVVAGRRA